MKNAFRDLLMNQNFEKLDIAPELVGVFKNVIRRMAIYFENNDYLNKRDYEKIFKEFLIDGDFKFEFSEEPDQLGASGFYDYSKNRIVINSKLSGENLYLEQVLCHEFIHFLVMHENHDKLVNSSNFLRFVNEALTESLARNIYPDLENVSSYDPQVEMMNFANLLMDRVNNYGVFLQYGDDSFTSSNSLIRFKRDVKNYHTKFSKTGYVLSEAKEDEDYISAQRSLINMLISPNLIKTVDQYVEILEKLSHRPVEDAEFINGLLNSIETNILSKTMVTFNKDEKEFEPELRKQLRKLRDTFIKCKDFLYEDVHELEFDGIGLFIGKDHKFKKHPTSDKNVSRCVSTYLDKLILSCYKNSKKTLEETIYFKDMVFESPVKRAVNKTKKMIGARTSNDVRAIYSALDTGKEIVSIERFDLPNISGGKNNLYKYVVRYTDGIEILDSLEPEEVVENIDLADFKGIVGKSRDDGLIWFENKKKVSGYKVSSVPSSKLTSMRVAEIKSVFTSTFSKKTIDLIIEQYKKSKDFDSNLDDEDIEYFALEWYAQEFISKKDEEYFEKIDEKIKSGLPEMFIFTDGDEIGMGTLGFSVFDAEKTVLYSKNGGGLYDEFVPTLKRTGAKREVPNLYKINKDGSLSLNTNTTKKTQNILKEQAEKLKEKPEKVDRPTKLSDYWGKGKISEEEKREFEKEFDEYDESEDLDELRRELAEETDEDFDDIDDFMEEDIIVDDIDSISHVDTPRVGGRRRIM